MEKYVCIHGHFYQPPRENPWLEEVELQDSAAPYHDWNERITAECYAPNAFSRILAPDKKIVDIVNNYSNMSFNFGPTLLAWLEKKQPDVYQKILEADQRSQQDFSGHGSAIAQVYNHIIMPLANARDKQTEIVWGIRDFEFRFKRKPEGLWLAETAVDIPTLEILADHGIKFTILAPRQIRRTKKLTSSKWHEVGDGRIDPRMPYLCRLPYGKTIVIFVYDGYIAQDAAFGNMLHNGEHLAYRLANTFWGTRRNYPLANIALDGETFGHHHRNGDMTLAYCLYYLEQNKLAKITVYGEYLAKHPPTYEVEILENSSWSCVHGVERWKSNCGCNSGQYPQWAQEWRAPLRGALDWLRDTLIHIYDSKAREYIKDPWQARDEYIDVILDRSMQNIERFLSRHQIRELNQEEKTCVLKLLEIERCTLLMYTSCGWFFDEISGIETVQILRYAARAIQLAQEICQVSLESAFIALLAHAPSNLGNFGNGAVVYETLVKPSIVDSLRVGAHYAISSLFENYDDQQIVKVYGYSIFQEMSQKLAAGKQKLAVGKAKIRSDLTFEETTISFAVLHLGDHNLNGGVRRYLNEELFATMVSEIKEAFLQNNIPQIIRLMDEHFGTHNYSLWHLFRDEQRKILNQIFANTFQEVASSFQHIYDRHYSIIQVLQNMQYPLPGPLAATTEFILNLNLHRLLETENFDIEQISKVSGELAGKALQIDKTPLERIANQRINAMMESFAQVPEDLTILERITVFLSMVKSLNLSINLWKAQNIYFALNQEITSKIRPRMPDEIFAKWLSSFRNLAHYLGVRSFE